MFTRAVFLFTLTVACFFGYTQENWKLKQNKEGIAIFTKSLPNTALKAIKVECTLPATVSQLVAVVFDVNTGAEWVYSTKSSTLLKQVSATEIYYYSEVSVPWPASNRDFIAHLKAVQDTNTKVVTIDGPVAPDYIPRKDGIVRISHSVGKWVITPTTGNNVKVEYTLEVDPGGSIPVWLINLFATKGPFETFKNLKSQLRKSSYAKVRLPLIVD